MRREQQIQYGRISVEPEVRDMLTGAKVVLEETTNLVKISTPAAATMMWDSFVRNVDMTTLTWLKYVKPKSLVHPTPVVVMNRDTLDEITEWADRLRCKPRVLFEFMVRSVIDALVPRQRLVEHRNGDVHTLGVQLKKRKFEYIDKAFQEAVDPWKHREVVPLYIRKPKKKTEVDMKYTSYLKKFLEFLRQYGGIESIKGKMFVVRVHTLPIPHVNPPPRNDDSPTLGREENPWREHTLKLEPRGRGYAIVVMAYGRDSGMIGYRHPVTNNELHSPKLVIGATYRLADLWPNIDWSGLSVIQQESV